MCRIQCLEIIGPAIATSRISNVLSFVRKRSASAVPRKPYTGASWAEHTYDFEFTGEISGESEDEPIRLTDGLRGGVSFQINTVFKKITRQDSGDEKQTEYPHRVMGCFG